MKLLINIFVLAGLWFFANQAHANEVSEDINKKFEGLEERIRQLESSGQDNRSSSVRKSSGRTGSSTTATGLSRAFNPALSVHGMFLGTYVNKGNNDNTREVKTGLEVQEVELNLSANVDSWLRADLTLAIEGTSTVEVEEFVGRGLITNGLSFQVGKFFTAFGKHNLLHSHSFPFIDAPLINEEILGEEGLNEVGVGANYLLPIPWYSEINLQFLEGENALFNGPLNDDFLYLGHFKNLLDVNDELTAELGGSYAYGKNDTITGPNRSTHLTGLDLTFKWKPFGREQYKTFVWQNEFLHSSRDVNKNGIYTLMQYQFHKRWWAQGRYDFFSSEQGASEQDKHRYTGLLAFVPSEFTAIRLQYNYLDQFQKQDEHQVLLQLNFTFGSHPAHTY